MAASAGPVIESKWRDAKVAALVDVAKMWISMLDTSDWCALDAILLTEFPCNASRFVHLFVNSVVYLLRALYISSERMNLP
eukprot:6198361-Pleurochrysis_carterae.AAC.3